VKECEILVSSPEELQREREREREKEL